MNRNYLIKEMYLVKSKYCNLNFLLTLFQNPGATGPNQSSLALKMYQQYKLPKTDLRPILKCK